MKNNVEAFLINDSTTAEIKSKRKRQLFTQSKH